MINQQPKDRVLIIVDQSEGCVRWQTHFYFLNGMAQASI